MSLDYVVNAFASEMGPSKVQILEIKGESYAVLRLLNLPGDVGSYTLGIFNYGSIYEIGIFSHFAQFPSESEVPQWIAVLLLQSNTHSPLGAWALRDMNGEQWAFYRDLVSVTDLSSFRMRQVVVALLTECGSFDQIVINVMKKR